MFSGDPVLSDKNKEAAQLIDLDINKVLDKNVRYAVLNVLSYNKIPLSDFMDAQVLVQFCDKPQEGKLFEPSRASMKFDLSDNKNYNNVCVIFDLLKRKMIFVDYSLPLKLSSAKRNELVLSNFLKFEFDNIVNSYSIYDLLSVIHDTKSETKAVYSDDGINLNPKLKHFVFKKINDNNQVNVYQIEDFL